MSRHHVSGLVAAALALLGIAGCGSSATAEPSGDDRLTVVATFSVIADLASSVAGDRADVTSLVPVGGDPHTFEPRPSDVNALARADVVLDNGLGLSPWFDAVSNRVGGELVVLSDGISEQAVADGGKVDPHLWMVPEYAAAYVDVVEQALTAADPDGAADYAANADAARTELAALDDELAARFDTLPDDRRQLVTSHDAYSYFAERYGLEVIGSPVGVSTEEQPGAGTVAELIDLVRSERVPTIFVESTVNPDVIERIAADAGVEVGEPLYGDSVGEPGSGAEGYAGMLRANTEAIVSGLSR